MLGSRMTQTGVVLSMDVETSTTKDRLADAIKVTIHKAALIRAPRPYINLIPLHHSEVCIQCSGLLLSIF